MRWPLWVWPFDDLGNSIGTKLKNMFSSAFEQAMQAVWDASLMILREAFKLADRFSVFVVDPTTEPISILWPMMLWLSGVIALGLFFWQLAMTSLRGGSGFLRLVGGPVQYGIALAVTTGMVGVFLAAADGVTNGILEYGLQASNFQDALEHTSFADGAVDSVKANVLGLCAVFGIIPTGVGYVLEMLFREAAIYILVATIPITAAGLLADVTKNWYWKALRWMLASILMKPVLALTLVLGVSIAGGSKGLSGLLAGTGVLMISLAAPFAVFKLFAFVDPGSDAGVALRTNVGMASYGNGNPALQGIQKLTSPGDNAGSTSGGGAGQLSEAGGGGGGAQEAANTLRFDHAMADYAEGEGASYGIGGDTSGGSESTTGGGASATGASAETSGAGSHSESGSDSSSSAATSTSSPPPAANRGQVTASDGIGPQHTSSAGSSTAAETAPSGEEEPPPQPPEHGGGPDGGDDDPGGGTPRGGNGPRGGGPRGGGGGSGSSGSGGGGAGGAAATDEAADAAVIT
ncbi:hypothetical protein FHR84_000453 [Actinopolyspora biskrensis]|uniref:TrbL/VirB6 plasmid conjugal transfer protein n=1 Tax=Actinopolyspora biskrensis TaxID=1470178 RepID=A0A852YU99_9ACTN|nr:hypothetical protein [Actinopolyspora biskrensis]NYH77139.1 hypothetical protein [Actinopolyspora biskrensis]